MTSNAALEHFHRDGYARAVRVLSRICGHHDAESAVQEAFIRALRAWTQETMPSDPSAWLMRVSRRCAIDALRRRRDETTDPLDLDSLFLATSGLEREVPSGEPSAPDDGPLRQLFACALPGLPDVTRACLMLRHVCALSVHQIAAVFRMKPATVAQRLSRAHGQLSPEAFFRSPSGEAVRDRLPFVLEAIYLTFSAGFHEIPPTPSATEDAPPPDPADALELVTEALRLAHLLCRHPPTATPESAAMLAAMLFHAARLPARRDRFGRLLSLAEQDRTRWDTDLIDYAFALLVRAQATVTLSAYHLHAGIAACHAAAPSYDATDWGQILSLYDLLSPADTAAPAHRLARTVALSHAKGADAALPHARELLSCPELGGDFRTYALLADLHARLDQPVAAESAYRTAARLARQPAEKQWLLSKAAAIAPRSHP